MKFIVWIVAAALLIVSTTFAISNRAPATLDFWPLPYSITVPLFLALIAVLIVGFVFGGMAAWWSGRKWRRLARQKTSEADSLRREVALRDERERRRQAEDRPALTLDKPAESGRSLPPPPAA